MLSVSVLRVERLSDAEIALHPHVPDVDLRRVRVVVVPWLSPGTAAMTIDRLVLMRRGWEGDRALLDHELVHVRQWRELGIAAFLRRYLGAYLGGRRAGLGHQEAYRAIPFEVEARRLAGR